MTGPTMRCYRLVEYGAPLAARDCAVPQPEGSEVLLKVSGVGVCHSDLHISDGHFDLGQGRRLPLGATVLPLTLGHEVAGEVAALGADATGLAVGEQVLAFPWIGCGACGTCARGDEHLCGRPRALGVTRDGGYAEYLLVPHPRYLIALDGLDPVAAAPLACSGLTTYGALRKFGPALEREPLVIIGAGGLGLMALGLLRMMAAHGVVVVEPDHARRDAALAAGALAAFDPAAERIAKAVREAAGGSIRMVLDLVGSGDSVALGLDLLGVGGKLVVVGLIGGDVALSVPLLPLKSLTVQGSYVGSLAELRDLVALAKRHGLPQLPIVRRPLAEAPDALADLHRGRVVGRTVLVP